MKNERIDKLLFELGLAESIVQAQAQVMAGIVLVDEKRVEKPSETFSPSKKIRLKTDFLQSRYVGRGGLKLEKALKYFHICADQYVCLDIGASTGGFTDCLLQNKVKKVITIDVGTNQIDWKLRNDKRVEVRENTNARHIKPEDFEEKFDLIVMDVSFISVTKIFPALILLIKETGKIISLIKPQFEVKKGEVGEGGIVRDEELHKRVVDEINFFAELCGLKSAGMTESPILGAEGNKEFLVLYERR
jgi:23S rRNA (cytidine1920-2'-O)/16S rRNA (cytidine1409-2'-O)-methyltransferase